MPGSIIGALRVTLGLDTAQFSSGAKEAEGKADKLASKLNSSLNSTLSASTALERALGALGGALTIAAFTAAAERGLEYASSLAEVAQQLGVTTKDLQTYRYAASQVGISQEEIDKSLAKLTVTMGKAREGVKEPVAAFAELSRILGKDVLKNAATAGDAIPLIADALAKVSDPAKRAAIEVELFGKTGQKLDTLLAGGSSGVNELTKAAQDLGLVLSDEQIKHADDTADKLSELKQVLEANIAGAVANNAQSIFQLADSLVKVAVAASNAVSALGDAGNKIPFNHPYLDANITRVVGGDPAKSREAAFSGLLQTKSGRQFLFDRNRELRGDLRAGKTEDLGAAGTGIPDNPAARAAERQRLLAERKQIVDAQRQARKDNSPVPAATHGAGAGVSAGDAQSARNKAAADAKREAAEQKRAAEKAQADERAYQSELGRTRSDELAAREDLTVEATKRAALASDQLQIESTAQLESIKLNKNYTDAQKAALSEIVVRTSALRQDLIDRRAQEEVAQQTLRAAQAKLDGEQDILSAQAGLARTSKERLRVELLILDKQFEALRLEQQAIVDSKFSTAQEKATAEDRLKTLGSLQGLARTKAERDNAGPLQQYLDTIPKSADEVNEALQGIEANGLSGLIDGLSNVEGGFKDLAKTVDGVANQIIASLLRIALQKGIAALFGAIFGGNSLNAGGGRYEAGISPGIITSLSGKRAKGGSVIAGRAYLVGEKGPEPFIPGRSGTIIPNDAMMGGGGVHVEQHIHVEGGVDLATRTETYRLAAATKDATMAARPRIVRTQSRTQRGDGPTMSQMSNPVVVKTCSRQKSPQ